MLFGISYFFYHFYFFPFFYASSILITVLYVNDDQIIKKFLNYFTIPSLIIAYYYTIPKYNNNVIIYFLFHWFSEICFNNKQTYFFKFICFWIGNIINAQQIYIKIKYFNNLTFSYIILITFPIIIFYGTIKFSKYINDIFHIIFYIYIFPTYLMVIISIKIFFEDYNLINAILIIGCIFNIASNLYTFCFNFCYNFKLSSFKIMSTYLIGQFLIVNWYCLNIYNN